MNALDRLEELVRSESVVTERDPPAFPDGCHWLDIRFTDKAGNKKMIVAQWFARWTQVGLTHQDTECLPFEVHSDTYVDGPEEAARLVAEWIAGAPLGEVKPLRQQ